MSGCTECHGMGFKGLDVCENCKGSGFVEDGEQAMKRWPNVYHAHAMEEGWPELPKDDVRGGKVSRNAHRR